MPSVEKHQVRRIKLSVDASSLVPTIDVFTKEGTSGRPLSIRRSGGKLVLDEGKVDHETGEPIPPAPITSADLWVDADMLSGELQIVKP